MLWGSLYSSLASLASLASRLGSLDSLDSRSRDSREALESRLSLVRTAGRSLGRVDDDLPSGLRDWLLVLVWLLFRSSLVTVGRLCGALRGTEATLVGGEDGLRDDLVLWAESALLAVAAVWQEYPDSLWRSSVTTFSWAGALSPTPRSEGCERLVATLALLGDVVRGVSGAGVSLKLVTRPPPSDSASEQSSTWAW